MKKIHRKIIQVQASILRKMSKDISSIKNGEVFYSKEERKEIRINNGTQYRPTELRETIKHLKDTKAAKIFRKIHFSEKDTRHIVYLGDGSCRPGRQWRHYGDFYSNKAIMCEALFPEKISYIYALIEIKCPGLSNIVVTDDTPDNSVVAINKLNETGVEWLHSYYYPGDNYYAYVRFNKKDKAMHKKLLQIGSLTIEKPGDKLDYISDLFKTFYKNNVSSRGV